MAKDSVTDYSTTAASNEDIGGVAILGTSPRSNFDNAFRELMSQLADAWAGTAPVFDTFTYGDPADLTKRFRFDGGGVTAGQTRILTAPNFDGTLATLAGTETFTNKTLTSPVINGGTFTGITPTFTTSATIAATNDGAFGATLFLQNTSASPAAEDVIASISAAGSDSAGNADTYAVLRGIILDPTSGSEDGAWAFLTRLAGAAHAERLRIGAGIYMTGATGGDPGAGKINATELQANGVKVGITAGTAQASTSGTSIDFTSIPAGVKRVTVMFSGVSTSGNDNWLVQIGDSGGVETSGYVSAQGIPYNVNSGVGSSTAGFITGTDQAGAVVSGSMVLTKVDGNTWVSSSALGSTGFTAGIVGGGNKTLSATLDRVRITTTGGTDTFDAGSINILYE